MATRKCKVWPRMKLTKNNGGINSNVLASAAAGILCGAETLRDCVEQPFIYDGVTDQKLTKPQRHPTSCFTECLCVC